MTYLKLFSFVFVFISFSSLARDFRSPRGCTQRNQTRIGTCSAFAMTCPVELRHKQVTGDNDFKVSSNWLQFVLHVKSLCEFSGGYFLGYGGNNHKNIPKMVNEMGYCKQESFHPYQSFSNDTRRPNYNPGAYYLNGEMEKNQFHVLRAAPNKVYSKSYHPGDSTVKGLTRNAPGGLTFNKDEEYFQKMFKISSDEAKNIYCKGRSEAQIRKYIQDKSNSGQIDRKFAQCALESLENKKNFSGCKPQYYSAANKGVSQIKKLLLKEGAMSASINFGDRASGVGHAVAITGFDDQKQVFKIHNSYGNEVSGASDIPYSQLSRLDGVTSYGCKTPVGGSDDKIDPVSPSENNEDNNVVEDHSLANYNTGEHLHYYYQFYDPNDGHYKLQIHDNKTLTNWLYYWNSRGYEHYYTYQSRRSSSPKEEKPKKLNSALVKSRLVFEKVKKLPKKIKSKLKLGIDSLRKKVTPKDKKHKKR